MISKSLQGIAALLTLLLIVAAADSPSAAPATSINGTSDSFALTLTSANTCTLTIGSASVTQQNGAPISPGIPATVSTFTFSRNSVVGADGPALAVTGFSNPLVSLQPTALQGGGMATFFASGSGAAVLNDTMTLTLPVSLTSNATQFEYATLQNSGTTIRITLNDGSKIADFIANGAVNESLAASGSFVITAGSWSRLPAPSTFVIAGLMLGLVGGYRLLRRRSEKPAAHIA